MAKTTKTTKTTKREIVQSRNWAITDFELLNWEGIYEEYKDVIRYMCRGKEVCPKTGKVHYQGWIQFINKKRMMGVKNIMGSKTIHVEACMGSEKANDRYCKKDNDYWEMGAFMCQGQRTDLEMIKKAIDDERSMRIIADNHFGDYVRYHRGFEAYRALVQKDKAKEFREVEVEVLWGRTGTGKTREGMKQAGFKIEGSEMEWWDGYEGEQTILIDEYDSQVSLPRLLNILDGYQLRLPIKGGFTYARWTKVIITSNINPREWHPNAKEFHREALMRRLTKVTEMCHSDRR